MEPTPDHPSSRDVPPARGELDPLRRSRPPHDAPPASLELERDRGLTIRWQDGDERFLSIADLRRLSPSADARELRAAMARNPFTVLPASKSSGPLRAEAVEPIGHYAIRIRFSDGHDTGIYTWRYLRELCDSHGRPTSAGAPLDRTATSAESTSPGPSGG